MEINQNQTPSDKSELKEKLKNIFLPLTGENTIQKLPINTEKYKVEKKEELTTEITPVKKHDSIREKTNGVDFKNFDFGLSDKLIQNSLNNYFINNTSILPSSDTVNNESKSFTNSVDRLLAEKLQNNSDYFSILGNTRNKNYRFNLVNSIKSNPIFNLTKSSSVGGYNYLSDFNTINQSDYIQNSTSSDVSNQENAYSKNTTQNNLSRLVDSNDSSNTIKNSAVNTNSIVNSNSDSNESMSVKTDTRNSETVKSNVSSATVARPKNYSSNSTSKSNAELTNNTEETLTTTRIDSNTNNRNSKTNIENFSRTNTSTNSSNGNNNSAEVKDNSSYSNSLDFINSNSNDKKIINSNKQLNNTSTINSDDTVNENINTVSDTIFDKSDKTEINQSSPAISRSDNLQQLSNNVNYSSSTILAGYTDANSNLIDSTNIIKNTATNPNSISVENSTNNNDAISSKTQNTSNRQIGIISNNSKNADSNSIEKNTNISVNSANTAERAETKLVNLAESISESLTNNQNSTNISDTNTNRNNAHQSNISNTTNQSQRQSKDISNVESQLFSNNNLNSTNSNSSSNKISDSVVNKTINSDIEKAISSANVDSLIKNDLFNPNNLSVDLTNNSTDSTNVLKNNSTNPNNLSVDLTNNSTDSTNVLKRIDAISNIFDGNIKTSSNNIVNGKKVNIDIGMSSISLSERQNSPKAAFSENQTNIQKTQINSNITPSYENNSDKNLSEIVNNSKKSSTNYKVDNKTIKIIPSKQKNAVNQNNNKASNVFVLLNNSRSSKNALAKAFTSKNNNIKNDNNNSLVLNENSNDTNQTDNLSKTLKFTYIDPNNIRNIETNYKSNPVSLANDVKVSNINQNKKQNTNNKLTSSPKTLSKVTIIDGNTIVGGNNVVDKNKVSNAVSNKSIVNFSNLTSDFIDPSTIVSIKNNSLTNSIKNLEQKPDNIDFDHTFIPSENVVNQIREKFYNRTTNKLHKTAGSSSSFKLISNSNKENTKDSFVSSKSYMAKHSNAMPALRAGGFVKTPTVAYLHENEAVVPLEKSKEFSKFITDMKYSDSSKIEKNEMNSDIRVVDDQKSSTNTTKEILKQITKLIETTNSRQPVQQVAAPAPQPMPMPDPANPDISQGTNNVGAVYNGSTSISDMFVKSFRVPDWRTRMG